MSAQPLNLYDVDAYTASKKGQVVANYAGDEVQLEYRFDLTDGPSTSATDTSIQTIPSGSVPVSCDVFVESTVSGGGSTNLNIGLSQPDGSVIDADGLVDGFAGTAVGAYGKGAGGLLDTALSADAQLTLGGDRTAGVVKVVLKYKKA
jgi:hypothetical protein